MPCRLTRRWAGEASVARAGRLEQRVRESAWRTDGVRKAFVALPRRRRVHDGAWQREQRPTTLSHLADRAQREKQQQPRGAARENPTAQDPGDKPPPAPTDDASRFEAALGPTTATTTQHRTAGAWTWARTRVARRDRGRCVEGPCVRCAPCALTFDTDELSRTFRALTAAAHELRNPPGILADTVEKRGLDLVHPCKPEKVHTSCRRRPAPLNR